MQCRAHVSQLGKLYEQFKEAGAQVVVILGDTLERAQEYANLLKLPFPVLSDPAREIYQLYELEKYFRLVQRTASIVVDRNGVVQYLKRTTLPNVWLQESRELFGFVDSMDDEIKRV
jgi:peroxiredoxin